MEVASLIVAAAFVVIIALLAVKTVRLVPPARARNVERLGQFHKTLEPGMNLIIPLIDRVKPLIDLREQVVSFPGQRVITEDNLVVGSTRCCSSRSPTRGRPTTRSSTTSRRSSS